MTRRRRRVDPSKAGGFYSKLPVPGTIVCATCGEERNSVGQADGVCLKCRWAAKRAARLARGTA